MAITIYKYAYHVGWDTTGIAVSGRSGGGAPVDLSNYYTIQQLQTPDLSNVNFANIVDAYHNEMLGLQGGKVVTDSSGTPSSEGDDEFYHLDAETYSRVIIWEFLDSLIEESDGTIHLVNDEDVPGPGKYYGTADDSVGEKGWYDLPSGGQVLPFQTASFANPLNIDCTTYKDWICTVTGDTTINLNNVSDGDAGMLELIIEGDSSGASLTITFGTMWTKKMGAVALDASDGADNIISWRKAGNDIIYTIAQIE